MEEFAKRLEEIAKELEERADSAYNLARISPEFHDRLLIRSRTFTQAAVIIRQQNWTPEDTRKFTKEFLK